MNLRTTFSKHFIAHEVKATDLISFKSSADEDLGTGIMLESLYVDGTLNACNDQLKIWAKTGARSEQHFLRRRGRSFSGPVALCSLSHLNSLLMSSVVTLNGGGVNASIG